MALFFALFSFSSQVMTFQMLFNLLQLKEEPHHHHQEEHIGADTLLTTVRLMEMGLEGKVLQCEEEMLSRRRGKTHRPKSIYITFIFCPFTVCTHVSRRISLQQDFPAHYSKTTTESAFPNRLSHIFDTSVH